MPFCTLLVIIAIEDCIQNNILSDLLRKHKGEVTSMLLEEYNEQLHIENEKKWSREEGREEGLSCINQLIGLLSSQDRTDDLIRSAKDHEYQKQLLEEFGLIP